MNFQNGLQIRIQNQKLPIWKAFQVQGIHFKAFPKFSHFRRKITEMVNILRIFKNRLQIRIQHPKLPTAWSFQVLSSIFLDFPTFSHFKASRAHTAFFQKTVPKKTGQ